MFIGKKPPPLRALWITLYAAIAFVVLLVAGVDGWCRSDITRRLPFYPNADIVSAEHDFLRQRALGETAMTFSTPDSPEQVREWFRQLNLTLIERGQLRGLADIQRSFEANSKGEGTLIFYKTSCGL